MTAIGELVDRIAEVIAAYPKASEHHCGSPDCVADSGYHCWATYVAQQVVEDLRQHEYGRCSSCGCDTCEPIS